MPRDATVSFGKTGPYTEAGPGTGTHHATALFVPEDPQFQNSAHQAHVTISVYSGVAGYEADEERIGHLPFYVGPDEWEAFAMAVPAAILPDAVRLAEKQWGVVAAKNPTLYAQLTTLSDPLTEAE